MAQETIGARLSALRKRTGLSLAEVARLAGYSGASSVQTYFAVDYNPAVMDLTIARRLAGALVGRGAPPIRENELLSLAGVQSLEATNSRKPLIITQDEIAHTSYHFSTVPEVSAPVTEIPTLRGQPKDVPVYGTALASDLEFDAESGEHQPVEQTIFEMGEVIAWVRRPPGIADTRKVYVVFVSGHSMEPRYRPGDPVFVDPLRPPSIGDDVIIQLAAPSGEGDMVITSGLIKTLRRRSSTYLELEQYQPAVEFRVPADRIAAIHRIIPWREAFGM